MAETAGIPSSSLGKVSRWWAAKKASGQTVQPWELSSVYEGEMDALQKNRMANRSLTLQAARDAESVRQHNVNTDLTREQMETNEKNATKGLIGSAATTGLGLYFMANKDKAKDVAEPGVTGTAGNTLSNMGTNAKKVGSGIWDKMTGANPTADAVSAGTTTQALESGPTQIAGRDMGLDGSGTSMVADKTTAQTISDYAVPIAGGFVGEGLSKSTGLGEKTSNVMPFGGSKDWNRAAGAGVTAGLAALSGANPWGAAAGYLGASIGLDKLFS